MTEGNPTNVVLCEGFKVNYLAFTAYTVFPFLACSVTGLIALYIQFWKGHIPTRVVAPQLDPKSVLLDPIGAIVGGVALYIDLIITGTGFVGIPPRISADTGVSAWMVPLPAADIVESNLRSCLGSGEGEEECPNAKTESWP